MLSAPELEGSRLSKTLHFPGVPGPIVPNYREADLLRTVFCPSAASTDHANVILTVKTDGRIIARF